MLQKILIVIFLSLNGNIFSKPPFSGELKKKCVKEVCDAVTRWQIENHGNTHYHPLNWTNGTLYIGLFKWGEVSGNDNCFHFIDSVGRKHNWSMPERVYHADDICVGQTFIEMYKKYGDRRMLQPVMERAVYVAHHPSQATLSKKDPLGKDERWSWSDALFMAPPVYAALYSLTKEEIYLTYLNDEFKTSVDSLYDQAEKLFYRDNLRISEREPNGMKQFWGRGNGWVFGALPLIIDNLPENSLCRVYYIELFREMAESVLRSQSKNGFWHASLLDPQTYPMPENSASAFMCYGLAWGIRNGYLEEKKYRPALVKGWKSLVGYVDTNGKLGYVQSVGAAPESVDKESSDVYGIGAFLLSGSEIYKMMK
jgi:rhamnogalacturonyl hydrolase YesR